MLDDAELADVFFIDARRGWAVGDRGLILRTENGGESWEQSAAPVECRFNSVCFVDAQHGFIAGGWTTPGTRTTHGVLLVTGDGGRTWREQPTATMPALLKIRFHAARSGYMLAAPSALYPAGVFITEDGGRSWTPLPAVVEGRWQAGDFARPGLGALAGSSGVLAAIRRREIEAAASPNVGLRSPRAMRLPADAPGWLVGEGGLLFTSSDVGTSWQLPPGPLPIEVRRGFDWSAVAVWQRQVWMAGSPGSRILHSGDGGQSWDVFDTGQSLPISSLHFADAQHGFAVGALGTILATRDGGVTWHRQRTGGTRVALLGVFSEADDVPWETLARLCGDEGYLGAVHLLNRRAASGGELPNDSLAALVHEAGVTVGASHGSAAWRFPLREPGVELAAEPLIDAWDRANDGQSLARCEEELVRQIRTWRPDVLLTHGPAVDEQEAVAHLVGQQVLRAVEAAGDPTRYPEQLTHQGLSPWNVQKVFAAIGAQTPDGVAQMTHEWGARWGRSLGAVADVARRIAGQSPQAARPVAHWQLVVNRLPQSSGADDFFAGIVLPPGGEARRRLAERVQQTEPQRQAAQLHRNLTSLLARLAEHPEDAPRWMAHIRQMVAELDDDAAAEILDRLAEAYFHAGQWTLAAEVRELLVERSPQHPLAAQGRVWLVQYWASGEAAHRAARSAPYAARAGQGLAANETLRQITPASAAAEPSDGQLARLEPLHALPTFGASPDERWARASAWGKQLAAVDAALFQEPGVQFPLASVSRRQGYPRQAERSYMAIRRSRPRDAWWSCADAERWLAEPQTLPSKEVWEVHTAPERPFLDGKLDDAVWQAARAVALKSPTGDDAKWPAEVRLAYDAEFLYVAVRAREAPQIEYGDDAAPRRHDADLSRFDRFELYLDLDRDWATYYRLAIDQRGFVAEDCWGDASWNPSWYVAAHRAEGAWHAEAALPWEELAAEPPQPREAWAVGAQRILPGLGMQSWTQPAAARPIPEGFGLLIFR